MRRKFWWVQERGEEQKVVEIRRKSRLVNVYNGLL
jgi:hypothetical protein